MRRSVLGYILLSMLTFTGTAIGQEVLPLYLRVELKRLEETWHLLDLYAGSIWPGWNNYREVPFLVTFPNGLKLLVGHPEPPKGFVPVSDLLLEGKTVCLDRSGELPLEVKLPLLGGGGPIPVGRWKGKPVLTVSMQLAYADPDLAGRQDSLARASGKPPALPASLQYGSEKELLINVHELFHCYQEQVFHSQYGNLRYNTDANYAVYSEIEGLALERAFLTSQADSLKAYLADFLLARKLKRESMTRQQQLEESEEDVREGTAVYAEAMLLRLIAPTYAPLISSSDDPYYRDFKAADSYFQMKLEDLRSIRGKTLESRAKCYTYGCFQALALNRLSPGWQKGFFENGKMLDGLIAEALGGKDTVVAGAADALRLQYGYEALLARHAAVIAGRDHALRLVEGRHGRVYVVNFKETGEYLHVAPRGENYNVGLITIFPQGIDSVKVADVMLRGTDSPIIQDQLFYLKWVDAGPGSEGYTVQCSRREEGTIYYNAVVKTGGFTLTAPKIRLSDTPGRVKITVLSKVKVE